MMRRILVAEDEPHAGDYLRKGLTEHGFVVDVVTNGIDARHYALEGHYDLIVLDVMMPGIDGFAVLQAVRHETSAPILMLTARDRVDDRVRGLNGGADDYLVKPFAFSELLARVQALLRRGTPVPESASLVLGDLEVELASRRATRAGDRLQLTPKEFTLLVLFLRRRGEVLSRTQLAELVWDMNFDSNTNVVDVAVRRLRSKLDDPYEQKLLHTVRGMGYVLEIRDDE